MTIHERYGRLMEERQQEHEAHLRTIDLLRRVLSGEIPPSRVTVTEDGWTVAPALVPAPAAESAADVA